MLVASGGLTTEDAPNVSRGPILYIVRTSTQSWCLLLNDMNTSSDLKLYKEDLDLYLFLVTFLGLPHLYLRNL